MSTDVSRAEAFFDIELMALNEIPMAGYQRVACLTFSVNADETGKSITCRLK